MTDHNVYMRQALEAAKCAINKGQTPFGAVIVLHDHVVATAHNQVWQNHDITAHAEIMAIRQACLKLKTVHLDEAIIYSSCEPCPMCFSAIHWARISKIVYGASIADAKFYGFNELEISNQQMKLARQSKVEIIANVEQEAARALFKQWQQQAPNKNY